MAIAKTVDKLSNPGKPDLKQEEEVYLSAAYWVYEMSPGLGGLTIKPICDMDGYCQFECLLDEYQMHNNYLPNIHI